MVDDYQLIPYSPPESAMRSAAASGVRVPANYSGGRATSTLDAFNNIPAGSAFNLITRGAEIFQPIWKKFEHTSEPQGGNVIRSFSNIVEFDIDYHHKGLDPVSFNVKFLVVATPNARPSTSIVPGRLGPTIRIKDNMQWADLRALHSTGNFGSSMIEIMRSLLFESAQKFQAGALPPTERVDPKILNVAKADMTEIIRATDGDDAINEEELENRLDVHFKRFCFPDVIGEVVYSNRADPEFITKALKAIADESAKRNIASVQEFLLNVSASHPKASVRYAAVEALSSHLDERVREFFTVRLKDERNRTVASSIAAAIS